jgi:hypothetical protein
VSGASGLRPHDHSGAGQGGTLGAGAPHAASHENGGSDEIDVTGLTGAGAPGDILDLATAETDDTLVLAPDGAGGVEFRAEAGGGGFNPRTTAQVYDECFFNTTADVYEGGILQLVSGTGAAVGNIGPGSGAANHPGILQLFTGSTTTGKASVVGSRSTISTTKGPIHFGVVFALSDVSDGTNRFMVRSGFGDFLETTGARDGVFFRYIDTENGGEWQGITRYSNTETVVDTNVAADTSWHTYEFEVNDDATSVEFFIDGVSVGTSSTNIPTDDYAFCPATIRETLGTAGRSLYLDAYWYTFSLNPSR